MFHLLYQGLEVEAVYQWEAVLVMTLTVLVTKNHNKGGCISNKVPQTGWLIQ